MRHFLFVITVLLFAVSSTYASCGATSCPLDTRSSYATVKGQLRLGYEFEFIDQDQPRIGTNKASVGEITGHHDEQRTINRIHRFLASWSATDRLAVDLALPLVSRSHRHIHNHHGGTEIIPMGWDFTNVGDLSLQGRYTFYKSEDLRKPALSVLAGVEFPTGKSEIHNAEDDHAEPGITPGTASYDFLVGGSALQYFNVPTLAGETGLMPLFFSVTYKMNGKGHDDYRLGNILSTNVGVTYPILARLGWITQLNYLVREKDEAGLTHEEVEKTGGEYLYVSPGLQIRLTESLDWSTIVQVPVRQRVNNIQLTSDYNLQTGLSYRFQL